MSGTHAVASFAEEAGIEPARVADASSSALRRPARRSTTLTSPGVVSSVLRAACDASQAPFGENASADTGPQIPPQKNFSGSPRSSSS